jgi:cystathionine beta-synthase
MKFAAGLRSDQRCVVILPDSVRNYMTKFINDGWMKERDFIEDPERDSHWWEFKT